MRKSSIYNLAYIQETDLILLNRSGSQWHIMNTQEVSDECKNELAMVGFSCVGGNERFI